MERYEVAFSGQLIQGADVAQVKANFSKLFQADEKRMALLFSGRRIVIKSGLDHAGAEKYRTLMGRAGAVAEIVQLAPEIEEIELTALPASSPFGAAPAAQLQPAASSSAVVARDEYMKAFSHVHAPNYAIAPVGADLQDQLPETPTLQLDLSAFSVAPVGVELGEIPRPQTGEVPDISHLTLKPL